MRPLAVGLIGAGGIAEYGHLPSLARSTRARLAAVVEPDPDRRRALAGRVGGATFTTLPELLDDPAVPVVIVSVPTPDHALVARAAFEAGKHVYLEKPVAATAEEGRDVVAAWREAGTVGMVGYNFRRSPHAVVARRRIDSGELGELVFVQSRFCWAAERIVGWRADPSRGGGCLLDLASHHIDLIASLVGGAVLAVRCSIDGRRTPEDSATLELELENGVRAQVFASYGVGAACNRLDVFGTRGHLPLDLLEARPASLRRPPGPGARLARASAALQQLHPVRLLRSPGFEPSFGLALDAFFEAVSAGVQVEPSPRTALAAVEVVAAARRSAQRSGATEAP